jgi:restriction system protein
MASRKRRRSSRDDLGDPSGFFAAVIIVGLNFLLDNKIWIAATLVGAISVILAHRRITRHRGRQKLLLKNIGTFGKDGTEFEERIKLLFEDLGWKNIQRVGRGGDDGVDLVAWYGNHKYIVQCKYYKPGNNVGSPLVREFMGAKQDQHAYQALLVTTSHLTEPAKELADRNGIRYWEREELGRRLRMAEEHKQSPAVKRQKSMQAYLFWGGLVLINAATISGTLWIIESGL